MSERSERLFEALSEIDEQKIDEAAPKEKRVVHWKRWGVLAAALAVVIGAGSYVLPRLGGSANSAGAGGAGADGASTFMSYAGPVFPLTLKEADGDITARREITLDFAPWVKVWWSNQEEADSRENLTPEQRQKVLDMYNELHPEGGRWKSSTDIRVTDAYTLTNASREDKTVSVLYPFASELGYVEEQRPALTKDGQMLDTVLRAGDYSGGFGGAGGPESEGRWNLVRLNAWEEYKTLLEGGGYPYQQSAFEPYPDLSDTLAIVYEFTDPQGDGSQAATIQAGFDLEYTRTMVLSFGFNGGSYDYEGGWESKDFFIPKPQTPGWDDPRYLIVLGEDVRNMTIQGYKDGGCEAGDERDFTVSVRRYEISLENILEEIAQMKYSWAEDPKADFEMYFGLMKENLLTYGILSDYPAERYHTGRLDDLDFAYMDRVFYLEAQVTIPAGGSVILTAEMTKEGSYDFYCAHTKNRGVYGYDMVTKLGSNLSCRSQAAVLEDRGQIEIIWQNFGFDLTNGVNRVSLDPDQEHYYLEVKRISEEK